MKKNYIPNLVEFARVHESNYSRLSIILLNQRINETSTFNLNGNLLLSFKIIEVQPFTQTLEIIQKHQKESSLIDFHMKIRIYEDVKMAEVISYQSERHFLGHYKYPNSNMYQPDEKLQLNLFLKELLCVCLKQCSSKNLLTNS